MPGEPTDTDTERRLRETGAVFIAAHDEAALAIRDAASRGMSAEAISRASGLSPAAVAAFLRAGD